MATVPFCFTLQRVCCCAAFVSFSLWRRCCHLVLTAVVKMDADEFGWALLPQYLDEITFCCALYAISWLSECCCFFRDSDRDYDRARRRKKKPGRKVTLLSLMSTWYMHYTFDSSVLTVVLVMVDFVFRVQFNYFSSVLVIELRTCDLSLKRNVLNIFFEHIFLTYFVQFTLQ